MEKYLSAVSEMYSQFKQRETHQMEKYIGRWVNYRGKKAEVIGYSYTELDAEPLLIIAASQTDGWSTLAPFDVVFKECESYWYVSINDLIGQNYD